MTNVPNKIPVAVKLSCGKLGEVSIQEPWLLLKVVAG
jgi:hypothetical protein